MRGKTFLLGLFFAVYGFFSVFADDFTEEEQRIVDMVYAAETNQRKFNRVITYMQKANMGIPGGENWLVEWSDGNLICYAVNEDKIINRFLGYPNYNLSGRSKYDIMKDIPGTRIRNGCSAIGDYNGDGFDEIFAYGFAGSWWQIDISGYNNDADYPVVDGNKYLKVYCSIAFGLVDPENGPAPVEFMTYQGVKGFKVYQNLHFTPPERKPRHLVAEDMSWYFYAWDKERQIYRELAEIGEDIDWNPVVPEYIKSIAEEEAEYKIRTNLAAAEEPPPAEAPPEPAAALTTEQTLSRKPDLPVQAMAAGALVVLLLGITGIIIVVRMKRGRRR